MKVLLPLLTVWVLVLTPAAAENNWPIVGVLAQWAPGYIHDAFPELNFTTYIDASYIKFVEEAGARAVPVLTQQPDEYYRRLFRQINGLLLPGGEVELGDSDYSTIARIFWDLSHQHRDVYFPIWGTCLGHEQIAFLDGGLDAIQACDAENQAVSVQMDGDGFNRSRIFADASQADVDLFTLQSNVVMFHSNCVRPDSFSSNASELVSIGSSSDRNGYRYVSILEHKSLPIYGVQFHPEKPTYEWPRLARSDQIPHTPEAIACSRYLTRFFISEARRSGNKFEDPAEEQAALIYNYKPEYSGSRGLTSEEMYFF